VKTRGAYKRCTLLLDQQFSNCGVPLPGWGGGGGWSFGGSQVVYMKNTFILNGIWAQDKNVYFGKHFACFKYFTYQLVPVLAPIYKQHILSQDKVSFLSVTQHPD
jgi:hypothetical protein